MIKVGIIGLGFMGKMHFRCYKTMKHVQVAAICDIDESKFTQKKGAAGNIAGAEQPLDLTGIELYTDADKMLTEMDLDAVSITLPTYLHCPYTLKALAAGVNVFCEKPMALNVAECKKMIEAAKKAKKHLQIGHCIRFWPEYAVAKQIIDSGKYGKVLAATFQRLSLTPTWSWSNWLMDGKKSGGAALDLHIHDVDYVQYLFGIPKKIFSRGVKGISGDIDHIVSTYMYTDGKVITAEGGWLMKPGFGFEMSFNIVLEKATLVYDITRQPAFKLALANGKTLTPTVPAGDGYSRELDYWIKKISGKTVPAILTPQSSMQSVQLVEIEKKSCKSGKPEIVR